MMQRNLVIFVFSLIVAATYLPAQTNPTLPQIDSLWRTFYGAQVHQGIVVYNKMTGSTIPTGHVSQDTLCIMRLISNGNTATVKSLFPFTQCPSPFSGDYWGLTSGYAISRDGSRIAAQNCHGVIVCDTSGAHMKVISTSDINQDCISLSFDDTTSNGKTIHRIVYAAMPSWLILRTTLSDTNTAIHTDTLWKRTISGPCYSTTMQNHGYTSVNKFGRFLSFNLVVGAGICIPVVVDLTTQEYQLPFGNCSMDGCQIRLCNDGLGTVSYHVWSHKIPTALWRWGTPAGENVGTVPCPIDPENCSKSLGDCGQGGYYWCETDTNYMIQVGDNDVHGSPGCYSKAYIRKGKTTIPPQVMYLGDYLGWPAMWIDPQPFPTVGVINDRAPSSAISSRVSIQMSGNEITFTTAHGRPANTRLTNVKGVVVSRGRETSPGTQSFAIEHVSTGVYFITWQESNAEKVTAVTITR
jgi:hypothetical protein